MPTLVLFRFSTAFAFAFFLAAAHFFDIFRIRFHADALDFLRVSISLSRFHFFDFFRLRRHFLLHFRSDDRYDYFQRHFHAAQLMPPFSPAATPIFSRTVFIDATPRPLQLSASLTLSPR
jgi:hypothetical protein